MTLNGVMAVTLRYFTEFDKLALQKTIYGGIYARVYCISYSACTICRRKESSRSLSHLLMSFLSVDGLDVPLSQSRRSSLLNTSLRKRSR